MRFNEKWRLDDRVHTHGIHQHFSQMHLLTPTSQRYVPAIAVREEKHIKYHRHHLAHAHIPTLRALGCLTAAHTCTLIWFLLFLARRELPPPPGYRGSTDQIQSILSVAKVDSSRLLFQRGFAPNVLTSLRIGRFHRIQLINAASFYVSLLRFCKCEFEQMCATRTFVVLLNSSCRENLPFLGKKKAYIR